MEKVSRPVRNKFLSGPSLFEKVTLPSASGVYLFKDKNDDVIYIGKAANLYKRVSSYFFKKGLTDKYGLLLEKIKDIDYIVTNSEMEALVLESNLIKEHQPRYNVRLKDDKKYPYLVITDEEFPRVLITRNPAPFCLLKHPFAGERCRVYGPYTDVKSLRRVVKMLREVFCLRSCNYDLAKKKPRRACLYYDLKRCSGPCAGYISLEDYNKMVRHAELFLDGKNRLLRKEVEEAMKRASLRQEYEKAGELRDRLRAIEKVWEVQVVFSAKGGEGDFWALAHKGENACLNLFRVREGRVISREIFLLKVSPVFFEDQVLEESLGQYYSAQNLIPSHIFTNIAISPHSVLFRYLTQKRGKRVSVSSPRQGQKRQLLELGLKNARLRLGEESIKGYPEEKINRVMKELRELLVLPAMPYRVEGIDISHIRGTLATGVITVFENGMPRYEEYRRFRIKFSPTMDDCSMIAEIVKRRYCRILEREIVRPDLVLVDGGKGQVMSANNKLTELGLGDIPVIGIAKRFEHIYLPGKKDPLIIPLNSPVLNFFKNVRDEAHRFAQKYHHLLRKKKVFL